MWRFTHEAPSLSNCQRASRHCLKDIDIRNNVVEINIGLDVGLKRHELDIYRKLAGEVPRTLVVRKLTEDS